MEKVDAITSIPKVLLVGCGALLGIMLLSGLIVGLTMMSYNNTAVGYESSIEAAHLDSENILGQYAPKLREAVGVTSLQTDAVVKVFNAANSSRYGKDGSSATVQWIREQNPNLDQSNYGKILTIVEAGRNNFANAQTRKIDTLRSYRRALGSYPGKFFYGILGFPTDGFFTKYDTVVISDHAADAFSTGRDNGVKL